MKETTIISTTLLVVAAIAVAINFALVVNNNSWLALRSKQTHHPQK